jgi:phosphonate transport system ATP-binding protein
MSLTPAELEALIISSRVALLSTAIVAIHSPELAAKHFDRIIALKDGRIFGDWQAAELDLSTLETVYQDA